MEIYDFLASRPIALILVSAIVTLVGRYVWMRWLSQSSRITSEVCGLRQQVCRQELMAELSKRETMELAMSKDFAERLDCGEETFDSHSKVLTVILMTQLKICNKLDIDCEEIGKAMVNKGIME